MEGKQEIIKTVEERLFNDAVVTKKVRLIRKMLVCKKRVTAYLDKIGALPIDKPEMKKVLEAGINDFASKTAYSKGMGYSQKGILAMIAADYLGCKCDNVLLTKPLGMEYMKDILQTREAETDPIIKQMLI